MKNYLSLVKFSHTIFAMPFALVGFTMASVSCPSCFQWKLLWLVMLCMVFARTAAMAFNRYLDRDIDASNPRTRVREIPSGAVSPTSALVLVWVSSILFVATTYFINPLCFWLSPVALAVVLGYSYTKRYTALCHFVLGLGLALAPLGAFLAVRGEFALAPVMLGGAVLLWVAGFDIIYALQDDEFDREQGLYSVPSKLGRKRALWLSEWLHLGSAILIFWVAWWMHGAFPQVSALTWVAVGIFLSLLFYQHRLVQPDDLSRVNLAFFTTNGIASLVFGSLVIADLVF